MPLNWWKCCFSWHSSGFCLSLYFLAMSALLNFFTFIDMVLAITIVAFHFDWSSVGVWSPLISIVLAATVLVSEIRAVMGCHMYFVFYLCCSLPHLLFQLPLQKLCHILVHGRPLCMNQSWQSCWCFCRHPWLWSKISVPLQPSFWCGNPWVLG